MPTGAHSRIPRALVFCIPLNSLNKLGPNRADGNVSHLRNHVEALDVAFSFHCGLEAAFARKETPQGMTNVLCPTPVSRFHLVEEKLYNPLLGTFVSGPPVHGAETGEGQVCD